MCAISCASALRWDLTLFPAPYLHSMCESPVQIIDSGSFLSDEVSSHRGAILMVACDLRISTNVSHPRRVYDRKSFLPARFGSFQNMIELDLLIHGLLCLNDLLIQCNASAALSW